MSFNANCRQFLVPREMHFCLFKSLNGNRIARLQDSIAPNAVFGRLEMVTGYLQLCLDLLAFAPGGDLLRLWQ